MEISQLCSPAAVAGTAVLLFFLYALLTKSSKIIRPANGKRVPPEASGGLPVMGHLHKLSTTEPAHITLGKMADTYGPIFTMRLGTKKALIVSNWEIAKECFMTANDKIFASRPNLVASKLLGYNYAMFGLSPYGSHWRHVRKLATLELLTNHRLEQLRHVRISEVQNSIQKLYYDNNKGSVVVDMKTWFGDVTLNTIFRMVVGKRFSTAAADGSEENEEFRKALRDLFEWFGVFVPADSFPFLKWFDIGGYEKGMKKTAEVMDKVFDKWLQEHKQNKKKNSILMDQEHDFMDVMMLSSDKFDDSGDQPSHNYDADIFTKATCLALILAGSDTTTVTMIWALSLLLNNEESLKKAQLELDEQVGRHRQVKESDIKNLTYLQAIVKETLRLYPAGPLGVPHESMEDCTVAGYHIPAGTRLMVNIQKLQRDPLVWEYPCEFRPERFLTAGNQKDFDVRGQNPQLIPFGSGRRMCPGVSFALQIMHLTLANLLHGFQIISRSSQQLLNMEESAGMTSIRKHPLEVVLTPRLLPQIYQ